MYRHVGAPRGGRVHWLLWHLRRDFKNAYQLQYNYSEHRYMFYRMQGHSVYDVFIVVRTSKSCWRCMYSNSVFDTLEYFSTQTSKQMALRMWLQFKKTDQNNRDREDE